MPDPIVIKVLSDTRSAIRDLRATKGEISSFGGIARHAFRTVAVVAGIAGAGLIALAASSVQAASDAQQSAGATESVFGKMAGRVVADSNRAAKAYGLSANSYRENATLIGSLLKNQGVLQSQLAGKTRGLIGTAADLAATFGGPTKDAVDALASAFKGEFDPIERYGISIKQSTINTEAYRVAKVKDQSAFNKLALAQQTAAKRQATLNLIAKQGAQAHGAFAHETGTLAHQQQVLSANVDNLKARLGSALLPILTDLTKFGNREVVPMFQRGADWIARNKDEVEHAATAVKDSLLPRLQELVDVGGTVVDIVAAIPAPLRGLAVEAGAAAFVLPKLTGGVGFLTSNLSRYNVAAKDAEKRTEAVQRAARTAAGIGGMLLLTRSVKETNRGLSTLESTAGAALTGFAVAGPVGALVGGIAGLALAVKRSADDAKLAAPKWDGYASSLNAVTGALTKATRAQVVHDLAASDAFTTATKLGISKRTLIDATLGEASALAQVDRARQAQRQTIAQLQAQEDALIERARSARTKGGDQLTARQISALKEEISGRQKNLDLIDQTIGSAADARREQREQIRLTTDWKKELKGLPARAITHVEAQGIPFTIKGIARLAEQYKLTPKQIRTVLKVAEVDKSVRDVKRVQAELARTGSAPPDFSRFTRGVAIAVEGTTDKARAGGKSIADQLKRETGKARPDLAPFDRFFKSGLNPVKTDATAGGLSIGGNLKSGVLRGFAGTQAQLAAQAAAAVRAAIIAARAEGKIHSPSQETFEIGRALGQGAVLGVKSTVSALASAVRGLVRQIRDGFAETAAGPAEQAVSDSIAHITDLLKKATDRQHDAAVKAYEREYQARRKALDKEYDGKDLKRRLDALEKIHDRHLKALEAKYNKLGKVRVAGLADERAAVKGAAQSYDQAATSLQTWTDELANRQQVLTDHIAQINQMVTAYADLTQLGQRQAEDGTTTTTAAALISDLQDRLAKVTEFTAKINELTQEGLNQTALQQLLQAGVDSGLATAEAIAAGGAGAIQQINDLQAQIAAQGQQLAEQTGQAFYGQGVDAAAQMVAGLQDEVSARGEDLKAAMLALGKAMRLELLQGLGGAFDATGVSRLAPATGLDLGATSGRQTVEINLTADQVDQLTRGRQIQADLDVWTRWGGRQVA